jgi:thiamine-monophosphate kinase
VPDRAGGSPGDILWLVGTLGDAAGGLAILRHDRHAEGVLVDIYRRPVPLLGAGEVLAPRAQAMMDVSDGLLLDARRMAEASGCAVVIELDALPLSSAFVAEHGQNLAARLFAATGGDDYALLAALPPDLDPETLSLPRGTRISRIGALAKGKGIVLARAGQPIELPETLGFEHQGIDDDRGLSAAPMGDRP